MRRFTIVYFVSLILTFYKSDGLGQTALHRCARDDNVQACRLLLSYGIDYTIISLQGYTSAQLASENVLKILKSPPDPADLEVQLLESAKSGDLETVKKIVLSNPHTVNCRDLDGRHSTPLHFAAGMVYIHYSTSGVNPDNLDYCRT